MIEPNLSKAIDARGGTRKSAFASSKAPAGSLALDDDLAIRFAALSCSFPSGW
jgi:hypothetical protein